MEIITPPSPTPVDYTTQLNELTNLQFTQCLLIGVLIGAVIGLAFAMGVGKNGL